jgi:hypothetical protein
MHADDAIVVDEALRWLGGLQHHHRPLNSRCTQLNEAVSVLSLDLMSTHVLALRIYHEGPEDYNNMWQKVTRIGSDYRASLTLVHYCSLAASGSTLVITTWTSSTGSSLEETICITS